MTRAARSLVRPTKEEEVLDVLRRVCACAKMLGMMRGAGRVEVDAMGAWNLVGVLLGVGREVAAARGKQ